MVPEKWDDWNDWARVLVRWQSAHGHFGLTLQALGHVCGRDPAKILKEMRAIKIGVGGWYCEDIKAPVMCIRFYENPLSIPKNINFDNSMYHKHAHPETSKLVSVDEVAEYYLEKYPWPEFKGMRSNEGRKTFTPGDLLNDLRGAAEGTLCPWNITWEKYFSSKG